MSLVLANISYIANGHIVQPSSPGPSTYVTLVNTLILPDNTTYDESTWVALKDPVVNALPSGTIVAWNVPSDYAADPLAGIRNLIGEDWVFCNGDNDTPDLRGRFILGYDDETPSRSVNSKNTTKAINYGDLGIKSINGRDWSTGGSAESADTLVQFNNIGNVVIKDMTNEVIKKSNGYILNNTIDSSPFTPPYYTLVYIMKL